MSRLLVFIKEIKEGLIEAQRHLEIYMFLQRFHARNQKIAETRKVF